MSRVNLALYGAADVLAGGALGAILALAHSFLVPNGVSGLMAAVIALSIVMLLQMILCFALGALFGSMEAMLPGTVTGMIVMIFPFLPMGNPREEMVIGSAIGSLVFLIFTLWDVAGKGHAQQRLSKRDFPQAAGVSHATIRRPPWLYDVLEYAGNRRRGPLQRRLFADMGERVLFAAAGTGLNFANFPPYRNIIAIDLDEEMLRIARRRARDYAGDLTVQSANLHELPFPDGSFDTVATASTFCSVPDPKRALGELFRVLTPGGTLLMFEHVRSRHWMVGAELDALNWMMRYVGPEMNRNTVALVENAGFELDSIRRGYLDVFLSIEAHKPATFGTALMSQSAPSFGAQRTPREEHATA